MRFALALAAVALSSSAVLAQPAPASGRDVENPAISLTPKDSPDSTGAIAPGANSFTEGQARSRIEARGFRDVTDLKKDDRGIWHGKAQQDGRSVEVMLDYRGNVAAK